MCQQHAPNCTNFVSRRVKIMDLLGLVIGRKWQRRHRQFIIQPTRPRHSSEHTLRPVYCRLRRVHQPLTAAELLGLHTESMCCSPSNLQRLGRVPQRLPMALLPRETRVLLSWSGHFVFVELQYFAVTNITYCCNKLLSSVLASILTVRLRFGPILETNNCQ